MNKDFAIKNAMSYLETFKDSWQDGEKMLYVELEQSLQSPQPQIEQGASKKELIDAAKYGYGFHQNTQFPEMSFDDCCKNNFLQYLKAQELNLGYEWVSVEDGLPNFDEYVLVYGIPKGASPQMSNPYKRLIGRRQNLLGTSLEKQADRYQDKNQFSQFSDVTHWRELPKELIK